MYLTDQPMVLEVAYKTYLIDFLGMGCGMLFVGDEKALLVDTGCGNTDIPALIKKITDLPVICAVTHEHGDHIGGIGQFERVYVPSLELETIQNTTETFLQTFLDYFNSVVDEGDGTAGIFREVKTFVKWPYKPELIPITDGDSWNLGGRLVTARRCQVHSKGHMVFIDDRSRVMFAGDSISDNTGPASNPMNPPTIVSLEDELKGLYNVKQYRGQYDCIWGGHADWGGHVGFMKSFDPGVLDRMITVGEGVLNQELEIFEESGSHGTRNYAKKGQTTLFFFREYLHDEDLPKEYRYKDSGKRTFEQQESIPEI